jgi:hypothetical protein
VSSTEEVKIKKSINRWLHALAGSKFFPYNPRFGESGIPDIIGCHKIKITPEMVGKEVGLFVGIEVKDVGNKPTRLQALQLKKLREAGGAVYVAHSKQEAILGLSNCKVYLDAE